MSKLNSVSVWKIHDNYWRIIPEQVVHIGINKKHCTLYKFNAWNFNYSLALFIEIIAKYWILYKVLIENQNIPSLYLIIKQVAKKKDWDKSWTLSILKNDQINACRN